MNWRRIEGGRALAHPLGCIGAEPHFGEERLDRVAGAQVNPVLLGIVVEPDEVRPVAQHGLGGGRVSCGPQLTDVEVAEWVHSASVSALHIAWS